MLEDLNLDNTEDKDHPDELTEYEWAEYCSTIPSPYDCQYCRHYKDVNQASTDRDELAHLLNISELQLSYITNSEAGHGLIKVGSALVPFANKFPTDTKLYRLMTTKPGESSVA